MCAVYRVVGRAREGSRGPGRADIAFHGTKGSQRARAQGFPFPAIPPGTALLLLYNDPLAGGLQDARPAALSAWSVHGRWQLAAQALLARARLYPLRCPAVLTEPGGGPAP